MKLLIASTIAASVLFSGAAYAEDTNIYVNPKIKDEFGSVTFENKPVIQHPYDFGPNRLNESRIRGEGRISVVHNEPAPGDKAAEITKARWFLQDNGYQCSQRR